MPGTTDTVPSAVAAACVSVPPAPSAALASTARAGLAGAGALAGAGGRASPPGLAGGSVAEPLVSRLGSASIAELGVAGSGGMPETDLAWLGLAAFGLAGLGGAWTEAATVGACCPRRLESGGPDSGEGPVSGSGERVTFVSALVVEPEVACATKAGSDAAPVAAASS